MVNFIEFLIFDGVSGELRPWISELEDFFVREKFTADEKMNLAQSLLEGEAEAWFYSSRKRFRFQSWEHLIDHMIWRFGDFSDPELLLLFDKNDRLLQKQIDEAKLRRMSRTAITPQESISSPATIHETIPIDKFSNQQVDEISGEKKDESHEATLVKVLDSLEEESVTQNQVHVSKLEPSLQIPKESPNVCENSQAVVGCEHQRSFQKKIRMDVVNGDVERSQRVMSITKNVSAHQVLDKMCPLKGLEAKKKMKVLKSWMFKYKPERRRSKKRHNQDGLYTWSRRGSRKNKGPKLQIFSKHKLHNQLFALVSDNIHTLPRKPATSSSMLPLYVYQMGVSDIQDNDKEMVADPVSLQLILDDLKSQMRHKWKSKHLRAVYPQTNPSYALDVVNKTSKPWETHTTFTSTPVASVNSLSLEVVTEGNMFRGLSQTSQVWEPGGVIAANVLVDWLVDFNGYDGILDGIKRLAIDSRRASRVWERGGLDISTFVSFNLQSYSSWCGWLVFDRGKNNKWDAHVDSLISSMLPSYAQDIMKRQADKKRRNVEFSVGDWVYIKLQPYRQLSVMHRIHQKLAAKFFDLFFGD